LNFGSPVLFDFVKGYGFGRADRSRKAIGFGRWVGLKADG
jgi:hypothetical protein